jgi:VanZ family protein
MHWLRQWAAVIAWAIVIWILSTEAFSAAATSRIILPVLRLLLPHASRETLHMLHFFIRKCAHFTEYFIFSLILTRAIRGDRKGWKPAWALAAVSIAACYAVLDEVHQAFVPERTGSPFDSMLDSAGALTAHLLAWFHLRWQARRPASEGGSLPP